MLIDEKIAVLEANLDPDSIQDIYVKAALEEVTHMSNFEEQKAFLEELFAHEWDTPYAFKKWLVEIAPFALKGLGGKRVHNN